MDGYSTKFKELVELLKLKNGNVIINHDKLQSGYGKKILNCVLHKKGLMIDENNCIKSTCEIETVNEKSSHQGHKSI